MLFRVHATELRETQQFLVDLQGSALWQASDKSTGIMHGLTKKANYVPGFPDEMKADLEDGQRPGLQALCDRDSRSERVQTGGR